MVKSWPEMANTVCTVARHAHDSTRHRKAVLIIIEYLIGTKYLCLTFERGPGLNLSAFTDANHAERLDDRRSASGIEVTPGNPVVSWVTSTHKIVTLDDRGIVRKVGLVSHLSVSLGKVQGVCRQRRNHCSSQ